MAANDVRSIVTVQNGMTVISTNCWCPDGAVMYANILTWGFEIYIHRYPITYSLMLLTKKNPPLSKEIILCSEVII